MDLGRLDRAWGFVGSYIGARLQSRLPEPALRKPLGVIACVIAARNSQTAAGALERGPNTGARLTLSATSQPLNDREPRARQGSLRSTAEGYLAETGETVVVDVDVFVVPWTGTVAPGTLIAFTLTATFVASISISHKQPMFPASPSTLSRMEK